MLLKKMSIALAWIAFAGAAQAATVYVTVPPNTTTLDPASVSDANGPGSASADLGSGVFHASLQGTPGSTGPAKAGITSWPDALLLTNNNAFPVTLNAGQIRARVMASYVLEYVSGSGGASSARCTVQFSTKKGGTTNTVSAAHYVSKTFDSMGQITGTSNTFTPTPGAGTITPLDTSLESLDMRMDQPGYTLAPGDTLYVWILVDVTGASTVGIGSSSCTARLHVLLPPGVGLDSDATVPTPWVGYAPGVPALGPFGPTVGALLFGLLAAGGLRRLRR